MITTEYTHITALSSDTKSVNGAGRLQSRRYASFEFIKLLQWRRALKHTAD